VEMGLIEKRGSYYSYGDLRLGQGRENAKGYLRENLELVDELEVGIRTAAGLASEVEDQEPLQEEEIVVNDIERVSEGPMAY